MTFKNLEVECKWEDDADEKAEGGAHERLSKKVELVMPE